MVKKCSKCKEVKPITAFAKNRAMPDGISHYCFLCEAERRRTPAALRAEKKSRLRRYGLTLDDWEQLNCRQNGCCKICGRHEMHRKRDLSVDHCHQQNIVRGLLCDACNNGLARFNDNIQTLIRAAIYLCDAQAQKARLPF
jgi:hypothetical protein